MNKEEFYQLLLKKHLESEHIPSVTQVRRIYEQLLVWLFPEFCECFQSSLEQIKNEEVALRSLFIRIFDGLQKDIDSKEQAEIFFDKIPEIYSKLKKDVQAILDGDPAAVSEIEITRSYPGFYAIVAYRIAHQLLEQNIPVIPRMITEFAHEKTGIDIHPGAEIGEYFCIDHGTGVVIGQTTTIGNNVKLYQGVTLGALSVRKEDAEIKRHPTLEDGVVVYAGATILGGKTIIGKNSVIGGNVWITKSVEENSKIYYESKLFNDSE